MSAEDQYCIINRSKGGGGGINPKKFANLEEAKKYAEKDAVKYPSLYSAYYTISKAETLTPVYFHGNTKEYELNNRKSIHDILPKDKIETGPFTGQLKAEKIKPLKRLRYTQEEIDKAEKASIIELANKIGVELIQTSHDQLKGVEHDSLVIIPSKNSWYWNSRSIGGKGGLSFIQDYVFADSTEERGKKFVKAMKLLQKENVGECKIKELKRKPFKFNKTQIDRNFDRAESYLTEKRGLSPTLVNELHKQGIIEQDKFGNALFLWKDSVSNSIKGITKQGTCIDHNKFGKRGTLKRIEKNSEYGYGFSFDSFDVMQGKGSPENIRFFESSIDAMSYYNLNPKKLSNTRFVSMDGLKKEVVAHYINVTAGELAKKGKKLKSIAFGVDNDEAGNKFMEKMSKLEAKNRDGESISLKSAQPSKKYGKDWNDVLKHVRGLVKEKDLTQITSKQNNIKEIIKIGDEIIKRYHLSKTTDTYDDWAKMREISGTVMEVKKGKVDHPDISFSYNPSPNLVGVEYFSIETIKEKHPNIDFSKAFVLEVADRLQNHPRIGSQYKGQNINPKELGETRKRLDTIGTELVTSPEEVINSLKDRERKRFQCKRTTELTV